MKIKDLKKWLELFNEEDIIIMSKDSEGNSYSPLSDIYECNYKAEKQYKTSVWFKV